MLSGGELFFVCFLKPFQNYVPQKLFAHCEICCMEEEDGSGLLMKM